MMRELQVTLVTEFGEQHGRNRKGNIERESVVRIPNTILKYISLSGWEV
jgi:hypothetical protein